MLLHCWVRPRPSGGFIAECLEFGLYLVEPDPQSAERSLRGSIEDYAAAFRHFTREKKPVRPARALGYWWKRPFWHIAYTLHSARRGLEAFSCEVTLPARA